MRNNDTRKIIDDARNTLVGQIPVPMMQCQQITLALTYKFMSDDDRQAVELGGQRHYFTGDLAQYDWSTLMSLRRDDTQRSELYRAGLSALRDAETLPAVFSEIFRDAVVPYGDHRTLALFLNTMDRMEYDDSEKLGDAYEYLLKTAEAQADAGQFRTPRHIIDFIVSIVNPQKHEVIIDPACGTAGFLVSAWQHVRSQHELPGGGTSLSTPDLTRLADNLKGYDISPEMTKLAMANMYLHTQNKNPNIDNYDTLTSADHWNEYADVILANPPFMTPKGGIKPHTWFRVPARRAEVLFVDYIASHLNEHGRAGVIVPEGVIFQSQNAYRQLRRILLDESLVAVVSLPGGVFNPYSGVKTSILILDKVLAPKTDRVAFFKVENDGYDLGAQRRPIAHDDLPAVADEINEYLRRLRAGELLDDFAPQMGHIVTKGKITADGEYNLSGERYRESINVSNWRMVPIKELAAEIKAGFACGKGIVSTTGIPHIRPMNISENGQFTWQGLKSISHEDYLGKETYALMPGDVIFNNTNSKELVGKTCHISEYIDGGFSNHITRIRVDDELCDSAFLAHVLHEAWRRGEFFSLANKWVGQAGVNTKSLGEFQIPLPPLEVQREIVAEIEGYQRVIDGARAVVNNWRPRIAVDPEWPVVRLPEACDINPETIVPTTAYPNSTIFYVDISSVNNGDGSFLGYNEISSDQAPSRARRGIRQGDVLLSTVRPNLKAFTILETVPERALASTGFAVLRAWPGIAEPGFILASICSDDAVRQMVSMMGKGSYPSINQSDVASIKVSLPSLEIQREIVLEIEAERALVSANRELVERMEQRIRDAIARVWGVS